MNDTLTLFLHTISFSPSLLQSPIQITMSVSPSPNSSLYPTFTSCFNSRTNTFVLTSLSITYILFLLPLFILVLCVGYQRWRKKRSSSQAVMSSHSDIFTFHMVILELFGIFGCCLYCYGTYSNRLYVMTAGLFIFNVISPGQTLLHLLTCVDRYLSVVHPITYLGLKQSGWVRIRNIVIGCVWLFSIVSLGQITVQNFYVSSNILLLVFSFTTVSFCSISVLCVLIRPVPGRMSRNRNKIDQSKQRAFQTIMVIMGVLFPRFWAILVFNAILVQSSHSFIDYCLAMSVSLWFSLPSSLVLPLLFLRRAGKLPGSKQNPGSI